MKKIYQHPLFWSVCVNLITFVSIIIIIATKKECPKVDKQALELEIKQSEKKIKQYENKIKHDSLIIWNSSKHELDSLRSIRFENYVR